MDFGRVPIVKSIVSGLMKSRHRGSVVVRHGESVCVSLRLLRMLLRVLVMMMLRLLLLIRHVVLLLVMLIGVLTIRSDDFGDNEIRGGHRGLHVRVVMMMGVVVMMLHGHLIAGSDANTNNVVNVSSSSSLSVSEQTHRTNRPTKNLLS